jgi:hypothetical protein
VNTLATVLITAAVLLIGAGSVQANPITAQEYTSAVAVRQDWIDWSRVLHVYPSREECINNGQILTDVYRKPLYCQESDTGSWVLYY